MGRFRDAKNKPLPLSVPVEQDWGKIPKDDLDALESYKDFFGKSCLDVRESFYRVPIEMVDGLRWMPLRPSIFYFRCLAEFVMKCPSNLSMAPDLANSFLRLVEEKARTCPEGIRANMNIAREAVAYVSRNQELFNADLEIYGDFSARGLEIERILDKI